MFFSTCSAGALSGPDFCFIFAPCGYDEPEILPSGSPSIGLTGADGGHRGPTQTKSSMISRVSRLRWRQFQRILIRSSGDHYALQFAAENLTRESSHGIEDVVSKFAVAIKRQTVL